MADEVEEEIRIPGGRSQLAVHEAQVAYLEETYGVDMSQMSAAEVIAIAYATRVEWRSTDAYREVKDGLGEAREAAKEEKRQAREAAAAERAAAKEAEKAEKEAAKAAKADGEGEKKAPAKKAAAAKKAPAAKKAAAKGKDPFAKK